MLQNVNNLREFKQCFWYCLLILALAYLVNYAFFQWKESPSVLEYYEAQYLLFHAFFMLLTLAGSIKIRFKLQWWQAALLGMGAGVLATCFALPLATAFSLNDGLERLISGYRLVGFFPLMATYLLFAVYSGAWLLGSVVYIATFGIHLHKGGRTCINVTKVP